MTSARIPVGPAYLLPLFPPLHLELMTLLRGLEPADWARPTACALWSVKDIVAHLLDSCLRRLSFGRDRLNLMPDRPLESYAELVGYLNQLNADWIVATRRLSPQVLMDLMDLASPQLDRFLASLDPHAPALFGVAWAGEETSPTWFDIGREYTERWLHQQQIREAVGSPGLTGREWLYPALDIFVRALPFTYRDIGKAGDSVQLEIRGPAGGVWSLARDSHEWRLFSGPDPEASARVSLDQDAAWKLFSKGLSPEQAARASRIEGDQNLGRPILGALAIMG